MAERATLADFHEVTDIIFSGVPCLVSISVANGDTLSIEVEQKTDASRWRGDFTSRYVEDVTLRAKSFKRFPVFVTMLLSAAKQTSDSVFVDMLTSEDLMKLNTKQTASGNPAAGSCSKRYIILTYVSDFDRIHYPLPLLYEDNPDPEQLKATIAQLRADLDTFTQGSGPGKLKGSDTAAEIKRLREENGALRQQLRRMESAAGGRQGQSAELAHELKAARKERDALHARLEATCADLERERGTHRRELRAKAKELQATADELARAQDQIRDLKLQVRRLVGELDSVQRKTSSVERIRSAYGKPPSTTSNHGSWGAPSSSRGRERSDLYGHVPRNGERVGRERDGSSSRPSRPSSAPSGRHAPPFDPTEYIRQKQQRERERAERRQRGPTPPPRSQGSSSRSSPTVGSRPTSANSGRPSASDRLPRATSAERGGRAPVQPLPRQGSPISSASGSVAGARHRGGAWAAGSGSDGEGIDGRRAWSKFPTTAGSRGPGAAGQGRGPGAAGSANSRPSSRPNSRPASADRATSPGRALAEVKRKLSEFMGRGSSGDGSVSLTVNPTTTAAPKPLAAAAALEASKTSQVFEDAGSQIADVDARLQALQKFLKAAKP